MNLHIKNLSFGYTSKSPLLFDSYSQNFESGITILKGFSGCGKSTLLKLIAGFLTPSLGQIHTNSTHKIGSKKYLREDLGFVFQQFNLLPLASLRRNLKLANKFSKTKGKTGHYWLERLGLNEFQNKSPIKLSGGQQQRAAIARAISKNPKILLLDEPSSGLDDLNTKIIKHVLLEYVSHHEVICIIATHDHRIETCGRTIINFNDFIPVDKHLEALA